MNAKWLHMVTFLLVVVGAINWGLVGLFRLNVVSLLFGGFAFVETLLYVLVGLSGVYLLVMHKNDCKICGTGKKK